MALTKEEQYSRIIREMITDIETFCKDNNIDHRFVGGVSYGGLLNESTTYKIDVLAKKVYLYKHNKLELIREDGTVKDIDFIIINNNPIAINRLKKFINRLKWTIRLKISFTPSISFEGTTALVNGQMPRQFLQYVTEISTHNDQYFLAFDRIVQPISKQSLEPWTVVLRDGTEYTTRNPIADFYAYQFRAPSGVKPKDLEKVKLLKKMTNAIRKEAKLLGIDYNSDEFYGSWERYIEKLERSPLPSVQTKRFVTFWYWNTLGTQFSHGKGLLGKTLLGFFNLVTRLKQ